MATTFDQRRQNDVDGLAWIDVFGWIRSVDLGRLIWPQDRWSRTRADRMIRSWIERKLVIARDLPDAAGRALVLAAAGARLLRETGTCDGAKSGKDWIPPHTWRHDLMACGLLCLKAEAGFDIVPERQILQGGLAKIPDGLIIKPDGSAVWLEVEHAKKNGSAKRLLAQFLINAATARPTISTIRGERFTLTEAAVAYSSGDRIDHRKSVRDAVAAITRVPVSIRFIECHMTGGVARLDESVELIEPRRSLLIQKNLAWHTHPEGHLSASLYSHTLKVWSESAGWCAQIDDGFAVFGLATLADAKRAAGELLAETTLAVQPPPL